MAAVVMLLIVVTAPRSQATGEAVEPEGGELPTTAPEAIVPEADPMPEVPEAPMESVAVSEAPMPPEESGAAEEPGVSATLPPEGGGIILPEDTTAPDNTEQVALLTSMNTYLSYLVVFGVFFVVVSVGRLIYGLLNMFF